jgi:hypothetical protein
MENFSGKRNDPGCHVFWSFGLLPECREILGGRVWRFQEPVVQTVMQAIKRERVRARNSLLLSTLHKLCIRLRVREVAGYRTVTPSVI